MKRHDRLIRIGRTDVRSAIGFFWKDGHKIYVAATPDDIEEWRDRGFSEADLHKMSEIEQAFRSSSSLKFISWCKAGVIVRQGASQVTFEYGDKKVVLRMR